jgi:exopolyphosphatase/guanosine-5'-triphosphate,3'-diphosphate pyrophosphatase
MITLQFYSYSGNPAKIKAVIEELIKVGIRCYVATEKRSEVLFKGMDPQYCLLRKAKAGLSASGQPEGLRKEEREQLRSLKIKGIVWDTPLGCFIRSADQELLSEEFGKPSVDLNDPDGFSCPKRKESRKLAGSILSRLFPSSPETKRYAIIDVGTNNVLLLWAEVDREKGKENRVLHRASSISALGKNMRDGILTQAGIARTKKILKNQIGLSRYVVDRIIVTGTSCSRDSRNISELSDWLQREEGIEYRILSENEEAELTGLANRRLFSEFEELILFDIGGGSTEFIYYRGEEMLYKKSLRLGVRRLEKQSSSGQSRIRDLIREQLSQLPLDLLESPELVGIGGTVTNISAVKQKLIFYDSEAVHKSRLAKEDIGYYRQLFGKLTYTEIAELMPFEPLRANVITTGLLIVSEILDLYARDSFYVSDYGLQFGLLAQITSGNNR